MNNFHIERKHRSNTVFFCLIENKYGFCNYFMYRYELLYMVLL